MSEQLPRDVLNAEGDILPSSFCPSCGQNLDAATAVDPLDKARPKPGDYSVCLDCTSFLRFTDDYTVRLMTEAEVASMDDENRNLLVRVRKRIQQVKAHQARQKLKPAICGDE